MTVAFIPGAFSDFVSFGDRHTLVVIHLLTAVHASAWACMFGDIVVICLALAVILRMAAV